MSNPPSPRSEHNYLIILFYPMLSSGIFKRGGPKKESGSVPVRPTNKHGDDPDGDSEPGSDASDGEDAAVSLQDLRDILSAPRSG